MNTIFLENLRFRNYKKIICLIFRFNYPNIDYFIVIFFLINFNFFNSDNYNLF